MVDDAFITTWVGRLRQEIPDIVAVILKGSYARGEATLHSDVDFDVLTAGKPREEYLVYFDRDAHGRLIHVSVAVRDLDGWLASETEPAGWTLGLPAAEVTRLLWAIDHTLRERLDQPYLLHLPGEPELEDFVSELGKIRDAVDRGNELAARLAAQTLARLCPSVLRPLNPEVRAQTYLEALQLALAFPVAPPNYREDMVICLGLDGRAAAVHNVLGAAERLVLGTLDLLERHADQLSGELASDLLTHVLGGTLRRYAAQEGF